MARLSSNCLSPNLIYLFIYCFFLSLAATNGLPVLIDEGSGDFTHEVGVHVLDETQVGVESPPEVRPLRLNHLNMRTGEGTATDSRLTNARRTASNLLAANFLGRDIERGVSSRLAGILQSESEPVQDNRGSPTINSAVRAPVSLSQCGFQRMPQQTRIALGYDTKPNQWPWMVLLLDRNNKDVVCGGTLISSEHVVTAAHCIEGTNPNDLIIRVGEHNRDIIEPPEADYVVDCLFKHKRYDSTTHKFDIALLKLKTENRPIVFSNEVNPICLPSKDEFNSGSKCYVTGWGYTNFADYYYNQASPVLQEGQVNLLSNTECRTAGPLYATRLNNKMVCAGNLSSTTIVDTCKKDSGGPLMCQGSDRAWKLWGITSWGDNTFCQESPSTPSPGVYTRVDKFLKWIKKKMESTTCPQGG